MGSLALRPGDSLTIQQMALSVGFRNLSFLPSCYSSYRALTFTLVGLTPTDHASFRWTHTLSFPTPCRFIPAHSVFICGHLKFRVLRDQRTHVSPGRPARHPPPGHVQAKG